MSDSACDAATPWYNDGLRFQCTQCGACCSGAPGHVWVSIEECEQIARRLRMELEAFTKRHVRRVGMRLSLLEKRGGDCEFLVRDAKSKRTTCSIHDVRPTQCRTWPFWSSNLESQEAWELTGQECPGIDHGPRHALPVIRAALTLNGSLPL